jgi:HlyD family secretion protein
VAAHQVGMARAALGRMQGPGGKRAQADEIALASPIAGQVLRVLQESETVVAAGQVLLEVGDADALEVVADVLTRDAVHIVPGAPVAVERWGADQPIRAHVHRVEPSAFTRLSALGVEEQRVNVIIDFDDPPEAWKKLGDGFRVEVAIEVWGAEDVLTVPVSAVFRHGDTWARQAHAGGGGAQEPGSRADPLGPRRRRARDRAPERSRAGRRRAHGAAPVAAGPAPGRAAHRITRRCGSGRSAPRCGRPRPWWGS